MASQDNKFSERLKRVRSSVRSLVRLSLPRNKSRKQEAIPLLEKIIEPKLVSSKIISVRVSKTIPFQKQPEIESQYLWEFCSYPATPSTKLHKRPPPKFYQFTRLPYELRMKIYRMIPCPRLVHYNGFGACISDLNVDNRPPVIMQICKESREEGLRIYRLSPNVSLTLIGQIERGVEPNLSDLEGQTTFPFRFCGEQDLLLWSRYSSTVKRTFDDDAARMLDPRTLKHVRNLAIVLTFWNKIVSNPKYQQTYAAIRKAPNLRMLCLVGEETPSPMYYRGKVRKRIVNWDGPGDRARPYFRARQLIRWEKSVKKDGKEKVWRRWDDNVLGKAEKENAQRRSPNIRFAEVYLADSQKRKGKPQFRMDEW